MKRGENQSSEPRLIDSLPRCFLWRCQEQRDCSPLSSLSLLVFPPPLPLFHPSLASSPIITLSSPPKCLTKLPQHLSHFSLHCSSSSAIPRKPSHFLFWPISSARRRDAFIASHLGLQNDTPLILLFCNLQRKKGELLHLSYL